MTVIIIVTSEMTSSVRLTRSHGYSSKNRHKDNVKHAYIHLNQIMCSNIMHYENNSTIVQILVIIQPWKNRRRVSLTARYNDQLGHTGASQISWQSPV